MVLTKPEFDVAIIGGGPAGSSMGAYLAKAGVTAVVFERELFPRPHVGESLVPSSTRVFKDLDFLPQMEEAKFPHKFGAVWTADDKQKVPYQLATRKSPRRIKAMPAMRRRGMSSPKSSPPSKGVRAKASATNG